MIRSLLGFLAGSLAAYVCAAVLITQFNLAAINGLGYAVPFGLRLSTTVEDLIGLIMIYLPLVAIALIIAWLFTGQVLTRWFLKPSAPLYALAGFVGIVAIHIVLKALVDISGVAPTRHVGGLLAQGVAGAVGGWVFYLVSAGRKQ